MPLRLAIICGLVTLAVAPLRAEDEVDYLRDVKPLLTRYCARCHGVDDQQAGLRVDTFAGLRKGGESGPAVVAGDEKSLLLRALRGAGELTRMPPEDELQPKPGEIELIVRWIAQGAPAPAGEAAPAETRESNHWSFQPVTRPELPHVELAAWARNPIDVFVLARLEAEGLAPAPEADRVTLIRRLSYDLLGLPPTPAEIDAFVSDERPDAYERLVERLLASPHYGERWGRHWLDLARYADSNGFTRDMPRIIWKYRDWVIAALNANMPFDRFTIEQIAGDMLPEASWSQRVATGFHRNTLFNEEGGTDPEQFRVERVVDRVNTTGAVFLGLTIGCAQCHSHKYDPITQREYYQLYAFLNNADEPTIDVPSPRQIAEGAPARRKKIRAQIDRLEKEFEDKQPALEELEKEWEAQLTEEDKKKLPFQVVNALSLPRKERTDALNGHLYRYFNQTELAREEFPLLDRIAELRAREPEFIETMVMRERDEPRETFVQIRGDFLRPGARVEPAVLSVLPPLSEPAAEPPTRYDLARWLVDPANPLTPRVTINRIWMRLFGRGIVETENDFGAQGAPPTHPELLDWLADEFVRTGWNVKAMQRLIVTSATYRQSSHERPDLARIDPKNKLLARQNRLRLDAEIIRDAALAASGQLTRTIGGPSVYPPQPEGVFDFTQDKKPWPTATGPDRYRRGMYTYLWRSSPYPALTVFDFPDANVTCTRRIRSNTPLQSLTLANDATFVEFARGLAARLLDEPGEPSVRVRRAFRLCLSRRPASIEAARLEAFYHQQLEEFNRDEEAARRMAGDLDPPVEAAAWTALARVLLNLDEFITRE